MRHPALTRVLAICLAILCLVMLLAGLGIVRGAVKDRSSALRDAERLEGRVEEYEQLLTALAEGEDYEHQRSLLDARQQAHEKLAAEHRFTLATYTATRGGVKMGMEQLETAEAALISGKALYRQGVEEFEKQAALFEEGYRQFQQGKQQLETAAGLLNMAEDVLNTGDEQLALARGAVAALEDAGPETRRELSLTAYDSLILSADSIQRLLDGLKEQGGITPEQMQMLSQLLEDRLTQDAETPVEPEIPADPENPETEFPEFEGLSPEQIDQLQQRIEERLGMTLPEFRAQLQAERDALAAGEADVPMDEEQFLQTAILYAAYREQIRSALEEGEMLLTQVRARLSELKEQMENARAELEQAEPLMEAGRAGIEQGKQALEQAGAQISAGEAALHEGKKQLLEQQEKLRQQAEQLREEKVRLNREARELKNDERLAENREAQEKRETSLRLMLRDRETIEQRLDAGEELLPAAKETARELRHATEKTWRGRLLTAGLMALGAIFGFAAMPACFERRKGRRALIVPPVLCALCAAGAELLCRIMGRGDSYSALAAGIFALLLLPAALPREKKRN